jgi:hypothetical protein
MASPTFLGLPRELRDTIYSYLHCEIKVYSPWRDSPNGSNMRNMCSFALKNAPLPCVLRVNTQVRDEYFQSHPFHRLSAITEFDMYDDQEGNLTDEEEDFVNAAVSRLRSITLRKVESQYGSDFVVSEEWADLATAAKVFMAKAPKDTILHIMMENSQDPDEVDHAALSQFWKEYSAKKREEQFFCPPKNLAGQFLSNGGEGYMLGFAAMLVSYSDGGAGMDKYSVINEAHQFCHQIRMLGWYTFTSSGISDTSVDYVELAEWASKSLCTYPLKVLEKLGDEELEIVACYPFIIQGWREI